MLQFLPQQRAKRLNLMTLVLMLWALFVMLALKLLVGWATNSMVLLAAAMHTLLSALSTLISLQSNRFPQSPNRFFSYQYGRLEVGTSFLLWALLGFGELSIFAMVLRRWQGAAADVTVSAPLVQLVGLMGLVSFCFALVERYIARITDSLLLSGNASLILQEAWLNLLALCSLLLVRYGYGSVDTALACFILPFVVFNGWCWLGRQLPQLFRADAIAPEAIAHIAQRTDGVLRCIPLRSYGLVGRQVHIDLQLQIHPEFESMANRLVDQVKKSLRQHYGPVEVKVQLIGKGKPSYKPVPQGPQRTDRRSLDFLDWN